MKQQKLESIEFSTVSEKFRHDVRLKTYFTTPIIPTNFSDSGQRRIHSLSLLIDPIQRREEFTDIVDKWFKKAKANTVARTRVLTEWGSAQYGTDRLIRAANSFDLLEGKSEENGLANRIISRSKETIEKFPKNMQNALKDVIKSAVTCRNQFVHGPRKGKKAVNYGNCVIFYSDTLEFLFLASELVDCGWNMNSWMSKKARDWHPFVLYIDSFDDRYRMCKKHIAQSKSWGCFKIRLNSFSGAGI